MSMAIRPGHVLISGTIAAVDLRLFAAILRGASSGHPDLVVDTHDLIDFLPALLRLLITLAAEFRGRGGSMKLRGLDDAAHRIGGT